MHHFTAEQQTITHTHLRRNRLFHLTTLIKRPLVTAGNDACSAVVLAEVAEREQEADLGLGALGSELCVRRVGCQVTVEDLARLGAHCIERRGRGKPIVTVVAPFAETSLADGMDEVILDDAGAESG
jgi:hypothetical protein